MPEKLDDFDAVRNVVSALKDFNATDQERIIRWACEKLGLGIPTHREEPKSGQQPPYSIGAEPAAGAGREQTEDIRSFISRKNPQSDREFTAAVAYYYRFVAPVDEQKETISAADLQDACRKADRGRLVRPAQTLVNAHHAGLLDNKGRGRYSINAVGENLVSMALPRGTDAGTSKRVSSKRASRARKNAKNSRTRR